MDVCNRFDLQQKWDLTVPFCRVGLKEPKATQEGYRDTEDNADPPIGRARADALPDSSSEGHLTPNFSSENRAPACVFCQCWLRGAGEAVCVVGLARISSSAMAQSGDKLPWLKLVCLVANQISSSKKNRYSLRPKKSVVFFIFRHLVWPSVLFKFFV
jgi:hypothetical protein